MSHYVAVWTAILIKTNYWEDSEVIFDTMNCIYVFVCFLQETVSSQTGAVVWGVHPG